MDSMKRINVNDVFLVKRPWDIKVGTVDRIAVIVKEKHRYYAVCEPVLYPSYYGMSRPYKICYQPCELAPEYKLESFADLLKWVNKRPNILEYYKGAAKGYEREKRALDEFNNYLNRLKLMFMEAAHV